MRYKCARGAVPPLGQSWHGPASRTDVSRQSCLRPAPWAVMAWSRIRTECVSAVVAGANFLT